MFNMNLICIALVAAVFGVLTLSARGQDEDAKKPSSDLKASSSSNQQQRQALVDIDLPKNFDLFNPKNSSSSFQWRRTELGGAEKCTNNNDVDSAGAAQLLISSNAAFVFGSSRFVDMASLPFAKWVSQSAGGANATYAAYDASLQLKGAPLPLNASEILQARFLFACETFGTAEHPFPAEAVVRAQDDPRLGACSAYLSDVDHGIEFGFVLTNRGVWAAYNRQPVRRAQKKEKYQAFEVYRRLGDRGAGTFIDGKIAINSAAHATRFYINNQVVWSVGDWGKLSAVSADTNNTVVMQTDGNEEVIDIKSMTFFINNEHKMDQADPNRDASKNVALKDSTGLVRLTSEPGYYGPDMKFWDEKSKRESSLFNQGAKLSLGRLRIESFPIAQKQ